MRHEFSLGPMNYQAILDSSQRFTSPTAKSKASNELRFLLSECMCSLGILPQGQTILLLPAFRRLRRQWR
jgi:hypothetical protein